MAPAPLLTVENVSKHFGGIHALTDVSLAVEPGRIFGLIGPNGSGKTTLFNVITGFLNADRGEIRFDGKPIQNMTSDAIARAGLCRTFQGSLNPQRLTVMENMLLAPQGQIGEIVWRGFFHYGQVRRQERTAVARAREILDMVMLGHQTDTLVGSLSGGQKKLLMLAQALMVEPKLILLDEPVAGVNPRLIEDIVRIIRQLLASGRNFLIVEHNMHVVRQLCDEIYVLDAGRVIASGHTEETLQRDDVLRAYLAPQAKKREGAAILESQSA